MIQLSNLSKSFGDRVLLDSVSWQIDNRERVGLSGPNGAGKTTLLKMLAGLDEPDGGLVVKPAGLTIGYLPQDGLHHTGRTLIEEAGQAFKTAARHARRDRRARGPARPTTARTIPSMKACSAATASCRRASGGSRATASI